MNLRTFFIKIIIPVLIIVLAVMGNKYLASSKAERKKPQIKEKVWQVETQKAHIENLAADLELYATIESPDLHTAAAPASGLVDQTLVKVGQRVKKGNLLLTLDAEDFMHQVDQAKADVLDVKAQLSQLELKQAVNVQALEIDQHLLSLANAEMSRVKRLQQRGLGSDSVLTDAKSALGKQQLSVLNRQAEVDQFAPKKQQLQAQLLRVNTRLAQAKLSLKRSKIRAQFDGIVVSVDVAPGDRVKVAQALLSLYPQHGLEAKTRVPSRYQYEIQQLLLGGEAVFAEAKVDGNNIVMQLDRLAGQASANGIEVYFTVKQGQQWLRLGNFLKLNVKRAKQQNVIKLPLPALYGTSRLYVKKQGRLKGIDIESVGHVKDQNGQPFMLVRSAEIKQNDDIVITHLPNAINGLNVKTAAEIRLQKKNQKQQEKQAQEKMNIEKVANKSTEKDS